MPLWLALLLLPFAAALVVMVMLIGFLLLGGMSFWEHDPFYDYEDEEGLL